VHRASPVLRFLHMVLGSLNGTLACTKISGFRHPTVKIVCLSSG
jgi:hypothetical protein